jgi:hypothetical protein
MGTTSKETVESRSYDKFFLMDNVGNCAQGDYFEGDSGK